MGSEIVINTASVDGKMSVGNMYLLVKWLLVIWVSVKWLSVMWTGPGQGLNSVKQIIENRDLLELKNYFKKNEFF